VCFNQLVKTQSLPVLYQDNDLVVVNKCSGLLVHRSAIDRHATEFAVQMVRDQLGRKVYPVHRLDRPTSGALIFALSPDSARFLTNEFANTRVQKTYLAVVRGTPPTEVVVDYALKEDLDAKSDSMARTDKAAQNAVTAFAKLGTYEFSVAVDKFPTSRYSLVRATPKTGRKHQIRRHLRHLGHPIIGDVRYGSGKHNRFFRDKFKTDRLLLACTSLAFQHPKGHELQVQAPLADEFRQVIHSLGWSDHVD
jgi:tRNA pseudouridine65 synthase